MASGTIGQRFLKLIQHLGTSKNAFAQSLDKTATVIQHLVDERNKPGYDLLCKVFEVYPQVSKDWLLLGHGPMLTALPAVAPALPIAYPTAENPLLTPPEPAAPTASASVPAVSQPAAVMPAAPASLAPADSLVSPSNDSSKAGLSAYPAGIGSTGAAEAVLTAALHAQYLQHQLALAEQRNQHLLAQQQLLQQMLELVQRRG